MEQYSKETTIARFGFPILFLALIGLLNIIGWLIDFFSNHMVILLGLLMVGFVIIGVWGIKTTKEKFDEKDKKENQQ